MTKLTLTPAKKKEVTRDWSEVLPMLGEYEPLMLARRLGPFVQGICLDRNSGNDRYRPTTFLHNLCKPFPGISLALAQRLRTVRTGSQEDVTLISHKEKYRDAARRLLEASVMPFTDSVSVSEISDGYRKYRELSEIESRFPINQFEAEIEMYIWSGERAHAENLIVHYSEEIDRWPKEISAKFGGAMQWRAKIENTLGSEDRVRATVLEQMRLLKVSNLPEAQLRSSV